MGTVLDDATVRRIVREEIARPIRLTADEVGRAIRDGLVQAKSFRDLLNAPCDQEQAGLKTRHDGNRPLRQLGGVDAVFQVGDEPSGDGQIGIDAGDRLLDRAVSTHDGTSKVVPDANENPPTLGASGAPRIPDGAS